MQLIVHFLAIPQFGLKPQNVRGFTDNSTNLNCTSVGYPSRVTRWYRNGIPVVNDDNHFIHANNTLSLKKLNWEDQGVFQCAADNFAAIKFAQVQVEVQSTKFKFIIYLIVFLLKFNIVYLVHSSEITSCFQ